VVTANLEQLTKLKKPDFTPAFFIPTPREAGHTNPHLKIQNSLFDACSACSGRGKYGILGKTARKHENSEGIP